MLHRQYQQWLAYPNWQTGIELLEACIKAGHKCAKLKIIQAGQNSVTSAMLREELKNYFEGKDPAPEQELARKMDHTGGVTLPVDLQELAEEMKRHYRKMDALHGRLREQFYTSSGQYRKRPNKSVAREIAFEILALHAATRRGYERIDYWRAHKEYLPGTSPKKPDESELITLLKEQPKAIQYFHRKDNQTSQSSVAQHYRRVLRRIEEVTNAH
ncbi:hypothetical protein UFOVP350_15 [uncultured Caudovirales phage]|uniref:Uncharacterized protein n=1 Tax=uncultured Caudovirales phage TaxID=2100421 RepID=A0A6J5LWF8_9CAUD|nr:hypothetical protein UFOVP350_15 [uncultured Caudovirales phage]